MADVAPVGHVAGDGLQRVGGVKRRANLIQPVGANIRGDDARTFGDKTFHDGPANARPGAGN